MTDQRSDDAWDLPKPSVAISIRWGDAALHVAHLAPPRAFHVGAGAADFPLPEDAIGARRAPILLLDPRGAARLVLLPAMRLEGVIARPGDPDRTVADLIASADGAPCEGPSGARSIAFPPGSRAILTLGEFTIEVAAETAARAVAGRWHASKKLVPYATGSLILHAALLLGSSCAEPAVIVGDDEEITHDQVYLMQQYLQATAEHEEVPSEPSDPAKGAGATARRFGVRGPSDAVDPHLARQAALRDAAEFGMIGLLASPPSDGASDPHTRGDPGAFDPRAGRPNGQADAAGVRPDPEGITNAEEYASAGVNPPVDADKDHLSTFAVDVDTGSYAMARRRINEKTLPSPKSIRVEEFVNSFGYGYEAPRRGDPRPFTVHLDASPSPFTVGHHLLRVAIQGRRVEARERLPAHLVYLVDTSGSMQAEDRIGLAKKSLKILTGALMPRDTVALCTYAGGVREILPPTSIAKRERILAAIDELDTGGGTAMASGIDLAYQLAERTLVKGEINRVVILSDGDANIGATTHEEILKDIKRHKEKGITLSTVGFGQGNYKDAMMERLADAGDGNYTYIDSERHARRVFSEQVGGMLEVIARDVKVQVDFDPKVVRTYRLLGYENRDVADKDFRDDKVDGGEIGAGHSVTAFYDVVLRTTEYSPVTVRLRHKAPLGAEAAVESVFPMEPAQIGRSFQGASSSFRFGVSVAAFAEILRHSPWADGWRIADVERMARAASNGSEEEAELVGLVRAAGAMMAEDAARR